MAGSVSAGDKLMPLVEALYPLCRSITGNGVRETLRQIGKRLPLDIVEVPSGEAAFDWTVPDEWNIREAWIEDSNGNRIVDFADSNLHVLNYSDPVNLEMDREELDQHLHSIPEHPEWIPYRTTYYARKWGFCVPHRLRESLPDGQYRVKIDATLGPGSLTYGEALIPGEKTDEVLISTHVCHPSLCNDNLSGIAVATAIGRWLRSLPARRFSYRLLFAPGTIGGITWLSRNSAARRRIVHGMVIGLLGNNAPHQWKRTRTGSSDIDYVVEHVLRNRSADNRVVDFSPYGYDERQYASPGINLPVGRLTRSANGEYAEYHTSADDLSLVSEERLQDSVELLANIIQTLENNRYYLNLQPCCEPQLGRRGLYRATGGAQIAGRETAMLWLLNQSDGKTSLLSISRKSGIAVDALQAVATELEAAGLLEEMFRTTGAST